MPRAARLALPNDPLAPTLDAVDLAAVLPFYLETIAEAVASSASIPSLQVLRVIRLVRVFRCVGMRLGHTTPGSPIRCSRCLRGCHPRPAVLMSTESSAFMASTTAI